MVIQFVSPVTLWKRIRRKCSESRMRTVVLYRSLTYNHHTNFYYLMDMAIEPVYWFIDNYIRKLGVLFVGFLISMMGMVIAVAYSMIVPYETVRMFTHGQYIQFTLYLVAGHWLLINVIFYYYKAYSTKPGSPPKDGLVEEVVGMCKLCIMPKPPRTHHCRVCNRCILKMDHHCPWLNQCVGHFNHRYFFMTMLYMWAACLYIVIGMWPGFYEHYWNNGEDVAPWCTEMESVLPYAHLLCDTSHLLEHWEDADADSENSHSGSFEQQHERQKRLVTPKETVLPSSSPSSPEIPQHLRSVNKNNNGGWDEQQNQEDRQQTEISQVHRHDNASEVDEQDDLVEVERRTTVFVVGMGPYNCILFEFFVGIAMVVGLACLMGWHIRLIGRGETSIEHHINDQTMDQWKKRGKIFQNPYDFGWQENWRNFLVGDSGISIWRALLLPTSHPPTGNGLSWKSRSYLKKETTLTSSPTVAGKDASSPPKTGMKSESTRVTIQ